MPAGARPPWPVGARLAAAASNSGDGFSVRTLTMEALLDGEGRLGFRMREGRRGVAVASGAPPGHPINASAALDVDVGGALSQRNLLAHVGLDPPHVQASEAGPVAGLVLAVELLPE
eukprot:7450500-Alexandrium_andersonii.AAC.1